MLLFSAATLFTAHIMIQFCNHDEIEISRFKIEKDDA